MPTIPIDITYCASSNCKNKCGRKPPNEIKSVIEKKCISMAYFCDENGEVPHKQTQRAKVDKGSEFERFS